MNTSHQQRVEELFEAALDRAPDERAAFLAAECINQPTLLAEVESLLAARAEARADKFLVQPAFEMQARYFVADAAKENLPQQPIGNYKIVERIGAGGMGTVYKAVRDDGEYQTAVKEFETTVQVCEAELALLPNETIIQRNLAITHRRMASALENAGDADAASRHLQTSLAMLENLVAETPKNYDYQTYLAHTEIATGEFLLRQNQPEKAAAHLRRALALNETILTADAQRGQNRADAAQARANLGYALALSGNSKDGLNYLREAAAFYEQANADQSPDAHLKRNFAETLAQTATILERENEQSISEARELFRRSSDLWQNLQTRGVLRRADYSQAQAVSRRLSQL